MRTRPEMLSRAIRLIFGVIHALSMLPILPAVSLFSGLFSASLMVVSGIDAATIAIHDDIELQQLSKTTWIHTSYTDYPGYGRVSANGLLVVDKDRAAMIDTPWNDRQTGLLFDWSQTALKARIRYVIATHAHDNCMGGLAEAHRRGATSFSLDITKHKAWKENRPVPQLTFKEIYCLNLGNIDLLLKYPGSGHAVDNIVVWLPREKILFGGCLVKAVGAKSLGNTGEADLQAWPMTLRHLLQTFYAAEVVVPGHGPCGGLELISHTIDLCESHGLNH